jgi:hypothetical protein
MKPKEITKDEVISKVVNPCDAEFISASIIKRNRFLPWQELQKDYNDLASSQNTSISESVIS